MAPPSVKENDLPSRQGSYTLWTVNDVSRKDPATAGPLPLKDPAKYSISSPD